MVFTSLTDKEKLVLYNLVKSPEMNDNDLSEKIGIKRSTVTSIRNRLKSEGYFQPHIIPNLPALGCRLFSVLYGKYNPKKDVNEVKDLNNKNGVPELFYGRSTDTKFIYIYSSDDFSEIKKAQDKFMLEYGSKDLIEEAYTAHFPFALCDVSSLFDYTNIIGKIMGIDPVDNNKENWSKDPPVKLTQIEKDVLHALVKWPEDNNIELAKKTGKMRSTVSKIRKKLLDDGVIKIVNKPLMDKLGSELLVFFHAKFSPKYPMANRKDGMEMNMKTSTPFFKISGDLESMGLLIPRNYTEHTDLYNKVISYYKERGYCEDAPYLLLLPIEQIITKKLDFAPLVEKLLFKK